MAGSREQQASLNDVKPKKEHIAVQGILDNVIKIRALAVDISYIARTAEGPGFQQGLDSLRQTRKLLELIEADLKQGLGSNISSPTVSQTRFSKDGISEIEGKKRPEVENEHHLAIKDLDEALTKKKNTTRKNPEGKNVREAELRHR